MLEGIQRRIAESGMKSGCFIVIGALSSAVFGIYRGGEYTQIRTNGPLEIAACMGNLAMNEAREVVIHGHIVVSNEQGEASGGHLMKGCVVEPTAELMFLEATGINLIRSYDEKTKLNLLKLT